MPPESSPIKELYDYYTQNRVFKLSLEHFVLIVELFPALMIIMSDGIIDKEERTHLDRLLRSLYHHFEQDGFPPKKATELSQFVADEMEYLSKNIEQWKAYFLRTLKVYLKQNPEMKETITDLMYLFAETSQDVSEVEKDMIKYLRRKVGL